MPKLILVKHSVPEIMPGVPASAWRLSPEGRERCTALAAMLDAYEPDHIVASHEPKAMETAKIIAALLGKHHEVCEGLHEHDRTGVGWLDTEEFKAHVGRFFACPNELVFGQETAKAARQRFATALAALLERHPNDTVVVVAHGTVISLFVAQVCGLDAFDLWRRLDLPSFVTLSIPGLALLEVRENVELYGQ